MKREEIVNDVISALERKNWEKVEQQLADNFTCSGAVQKPITKKEWVGVQRAIQTGMPDLKFNLRQVAARGDLVTAKVKLSGTHTADIPTTPVEGIRQVPKTGKRVELQEEELEFLFSGYKIYKLNVKHTPTGYGYVNGIMEQLGTKSSSF